MVRAFANYLTIFLHPFQSHEFFREKRLGETALEDSKEKLYCPTFIECTAISWIFVIIASIYSLITLNIQEGGFLSQSKIPLLFGAMAGVILHPLWLLIYVKIWEIVILLSARLVGKEGEISGPIKEVVYSSTCAHLLLLIPVIGKAASAVAILFFLFVGLKKNLEFSLLHGILTIFFPLIFLTILVTIPVLTLVTLGQFLK